MKKSGKVKAHELMRSCAHVLMYSMVILPTIAFGQVSISGKMYDKSTSESLQGGKIIIRNSFKSTATDEKGNYLIKYLKKGRITLTASYMGYEKLVKEMNVTKDTTVNFEMESSPLLGQEVIVSGLKAEDKTPMTFENISKKDIQEKNAGQDIPMLIENTPSVTVATDAGTGVGYTYLRIRGTDATRINVTVNGVPFNDPESHEVYWVDIPDLASSVENLQIQRGVGTSTNGTAAFGASLNLQTTTLKPDPYAEYDGSVGSYKTLKNTLSFGSGLIDNKFEFDGRFSKISSDGYIDRAFSDIKSFYISAGYYGKKSFFKLNIFSGVEKTYQAWDGVPKDSLKTNRTYNPFTYSNQTDNYQQDHYQLFYSNELSQKLNLTVTLFNIRGKGYYENYENQNDPYEYASPHTSLQKDFGLNDVKLKDTTITNTNNINQQWLNNNFFGTNINLNYNDHKKLKINYGFSWDKYNDTHTGKIIWAQYASNSFIDQNYYDYVYDRTEASTFVKANYQATDKLNLYGDLQLRTVNIKLNGTMQSNLKDTSQAHNYTFLNPKTGAFYDFDDKNNAYVSFAISNREPNGSNFEDAKPKEAPVPERLYDLEAGYSYKNNNFHGGINFYYMYYNDQLVLTGQINYVGSPIMTNVPKSYREGIELVFGANIIRNLKWEANLTLSRNKIENFTEYVDMYDADWNPIGQKVNNLGTTDIAFSPTVIGSNRFTYRILKGLDISLISKYVGKQYADNTSNNDRSLDRYFINNGLLTYTFKTKYIKEVGLNLLVNNLFSYKYSSNAWVYSYYLDGTRSVQDGYFPQAPVNFLAGISLKW